MRDPGRLSNKIVGYAIGDRMKASLAVRALRNAIALRQPIGTLVHSDRAANFDHGRSSARWPPAAWSRLDGPRRRLPVDRLIVPIP